jgi:glycosyltransferase involved in cell wall biosynthesis
MRIVIDMQGAQAANRSRGIGRYTLAFAQALEQSCGAHDVILALNDAFPESLSVIRKTFHSILPAENICVWRSLTSVNALDDTNTSRARAGELIREAFLAALRPDVIVVTSLFEGPGDDAVTSVGLLHNIPTAVVLYDLIPLVYRQTYLSENFREAWYERKLGHLRRADVLLAISSSSAREAVDYLGFSSERVVTISTAADPQFCHHDISPGTHAAVRARYGIVGQFVMYTGGIDHRKNITGLIAAYARLPQELRKAHQLVVVCQADNSEKERLRSIARQEGLGDSELVMTGFVPEADLIALYHDCAAFVFPSWHEGFGLPALEAMACGAPVIASNTSSLPEVVGLDEALFDPFDPDAMADKLAQVLTDPDFRERLITHGLEQASRFSWESTATRALTALEHLHTQKARSRAQHLPRKHRPRLAYVSPLPPESSGIADYSLELLPELARFYDIELIVEQETLTPEWLRTLFPARNAAWLCDNPGYYDCVLYHFGNSQFHAHMFDLLPKVPGVVVLHDFFLSGVVWWREHAQGLRGYLAQALYRSHGYPAIVQHLRHKDVASTIWEFPCNGSVLDNALGMIVHSSHSLRLARHWYGEGAARDWVLIPHLRRPAFDTGRAEARRQLGLPEDALVVCSFGMLGPAKLNHILLAAWLASSLAHNPRAILVFVGENHGGDYGAELLAIIKARGLQKHIRITGWADTATYRHYLAAADIAVQLRARSRGETSGTVLDCLNYGLPTIINAHGSMEDIPDSVVIKLPDVIESEMLTATLEALAQDPMRRAELGEQARRYIRSRHNPRACAAQYYNALEDVYAHAGATTEGAIAAIARLHTPLSDSDLAKAAEALAQNRLPTTGRQLLVDISTLVIHDDRTGIQRVVRALLHEWLMRNWGDFRVEPIYAVPGRLGYRYARRWTAAFLGASLDRFADDGVDVQAGDVFIAPDLNHRAHIEHAPLYQQWRRAGIGVHFIVHDLLPVRMPQHFPPNTASIHESWLDIVAQAQGALCNSQSTAEDMAAWLRDRSLKTQASLCITPFPMGSDIENSLPTRGLPQDAAPLLACLTSRPSFLMVGTVEPRKGQAQTLAAFEQLWAQGMDINLVIVGKQGWMVETLVDSLCNHKEKNRRLFWLAGISDEYLEQIYTISTCLIAASEGEGFGLPLIEAARHGLPIIARDIPVFREVAGKHAVYFENTQEPSSIGNTVRDWFTLPKEDTRLAAHRIPRATWEDSARTILEIVGLLPQPAIDRDAGIADSAA